MVCFGLAGSNLAAASHWGPLLATVIHHERAKVKGLMKVSGCVLVLLLALPACRTRSAQPTPPLVSASISPRGAEPPSALPVPTVSVPIGLAAIGTRFCTPLDALLRYPGCTTRSAEYTRTLLGSVARNKACTVPVAKRRVVVALEPQPAEEHGRSITELVLAVRGSSARQALCEASNLSPWELSAKVVAPAERAVYECRLPAGTEQGWVTVEGGMLVVRSWSAGGGSSLTFRPTTPDDRQPVDTLPALQSAKPEVSLPTDTLRSGRSGARSLALPCGATVEFRVKSKANSLLGSAH